MTATSTPATALLIELTGRGIELQAAGDRLLYRPRSAMTIELAERIKAYKPGLLVILADGDEIPTHVTSAGRSHADREVERFLSVCVPWPDGRGWYDPTAQQPALAEPAQSERKKSETWGWRPDLYPHPGGGVETFVERADRYRRECGGLPPGASRADGDGQELD